MRKHKSKKKKYHQTGKSDYSLDVLLKAKVPGKRTVKKGKKKTTYYEYRKNRSDMPGKMV
jgi:hypothetical protein